MLPKDKSLYELKGITGKQAGIYAFYGFLFDVESRKKVDEERYMCRECFANYDDITNNSTISTFSIKTSTDVLRRHFNKEHSKSATSQSTSSSARQLTLPQCFEETNLPIEYDITLWFIKDDIAFNEIENDGFRDFFKKRYKCEPPSRTTLSTKCLPQLVSLFRKRVCDYIQKNVRHYTVTSDMWTDSFQRHSYLSLTLHFISDDFKMNEILLAMKYVPVSHTAANIRDVIEEVLSDFGLDASKGLLVTDNGSNMTCAASLLKMERRSCLAHCLNNLLFTDSIAKTNCLKVIVQKCRKIYSALLYKKALLKTEQEKATLQELANLTTEADDFDDHNYSQSVPSTSYESIKNDTQTRWNSTLIMIRSILKNKEAIKKCLMQIEKFDLIFENHEIAQMKELVQILTPFEELTQLLSISKSPSGPRSFFKIHELYDSIKASIDDCPDHCELLTKLEENFFKRMKMDEQLLVSVLLDANLKDYDPIKNHLALLKKTPEELLSKFINKFGLADDQQETSSLQPSPSKKWKAELEEKFGKKQGNDSMNEVKEYLSTTFKDLVDPLEFWKKRTGVLAQLAKIILGQPLSSVPSERLFSSAGRVVTFKRSMLDPINVESIMFVKQNYGFCKHVLTELNK